MCMVWHWRRRGNGEKTSRDRIVRRQWRNRVAEEQRAWRRRFRLLYFAPYTLTAVGLHGHHLYEYTVVGEAGEVMR